MILSVTIAEISNLQSPFILQGQSYETSLKKAAEYGYEGIEIQLPNVNQFDEKKFFFYCKEHNLRLVSIATGLAVQEGLSLSSNDEDIRKQTIERIFGMIDLAASCGHCPGIMIGLLAGKKTECPSQAIFLHNLGRSLKSISDYAKEQGINVNLEPVNHEDCPGLNTWDEAVKLLENYECDNILLGVDLYHMNMDEPDMLDTIARYHERIGCIQLMEKNRKAPGLGDFDFTPIIELIKETGYDGPIIMECLPLPNPETALKKAAEFYHKFFGAI